MNWITSKNLVMKIYLWFLLYFWPICAYGQAKNTYTVFNLCYLLVNEEIFYWVSVRRDKKKKVFEWLVKKNFRNFINI